MFFDATFCSWLTCFFSEAVSVPPLALRSAATCRLMPFCCFSALAASHSGHLPALDALGDAVLLIFAALVHFVVGIVLGASVVLVLADLLRKLILLPIDLFFLCRRQLATMGRAVRFGLGMRAASLVSSLEVSPAVSWPLFTPWAMRSC